MTKKAMILEALGLVGTRNNRWRSIWRVAGVEARERYSKIFQRELNKIFKRLYAPSVDMLIAAHSDPLWSLIAKEPAFVGDHQ